MNLFRVGIVFLVVNASLVAEQKGQSAGKGDDRAQLTARRHLRRLKSVGTREVKLRLISDRQHIVAGKTFRLGLHFSVGAGWHIYGNKPGDGYLPTEVNVKVPKGFKIVATRWPKPEMIDGVDAGKKIPAYHKRVLIVATVKAPAKLDGGKSFSFSAPSQWQFCHRDGVCKLGKGEPKLVLAAGDDKPSKFVALFPKVTAKK